MRAQFLRYIVLTASGWLLALAPVVAQSTPPIFPLHHFFQANYDSTIIYQSSTNWNSSPNYLILAKRKDQVYFFTYSSPYREAKGRYFPGGLAQQFLREELMFSRTLPDTNRYFLPGRAPAAALGHCWRTVAPAQLWQVQGNKPARTTTGNCVIEDGDENTFYLLDKQGIKTAYFYAPSYYEKCEGKNLNRQLALTAIAALRALTQ